MGRQPLQGFFCLSFLFLHPYYFRWLLPFFLCPSYSCYSSAGRVSFRLCGSNTALWDPSWIRLLGLMLAISYICQEEVVSSAACLVINFSLGRLCLSFCLSGLSPSFHLLPSPFHRNSLLQFQCKNESPDFRKRLGEFLAP